MSHKSLILHPFPPDHAHPIARWVTSPTEAAQWANMQWPVDPAVFARWHADSEIQPYVLVAGTTLVGYGELWLDATEQEVELARLLVAPERRGQGVGQQLVRALLVQAGSSGYPLAFLRVVPENEVAIACYRRSGFTDVPLAEQHSFNRGQPVAYRWMCHPLLRKWNFRLTSRADLSSEIARTEPLLRLSGCLFRASPIVNSA